MLPTLWGRIQSRIFFTAVVGGIVTAIVAALMPASINGFDVPTKYRFQDAYAVLLWTGIIGIVWEVVYHFAMQWRWEKDWPTFFGFITIINEGLVIYFLGDNGYLPWVFGWDIDPTPDHLLPVAFFIVDFVLVWLAIWVWVNGPMRVFNIHWRFFGGRLV
jgi:hypothetical protein